MLMELMCRNLCHLKELLVSDNCILVKEKKEEHLIGRAEEFVSLSFLESTTNFSIAQC